MTNKASDAAIERVVKRWTDVGGTWSPSDYPRYSSFTETCDREQALSDALRTVHGDNIPDALAGFVLPVVVDPILAAARRIYLAHYQGNANIIDSGILDDHEIIKTAIAELRAIAAQGGPA